MMSRLVMSSQFIPILLNLFAALIGSLGQLLYKKGSLLLSSVPLWKNTPLIAGCICFCGVMVLFVTSYRMGGKVSVSYPFYATTFIWSTAIAALVLHETVQPIQWIGNLAVAAGVALIAIGQSS